LVTGEIITAGCERDVSTVHTTVGRKLIMPAWNHETDRSAYNNTADLKDDDTVQMMHKTNNSTCKSVIADCLPDWAESY